MRIQGPAAACVCGIEGLVVACDTSQAQMHALNKPLIPMDNF
jgi:hypothetical protein